MAQNKRKYKHDTIKERKLANLRNIVLHTTMFQFSVNYSYANKSDYRLDVYTGSWEESDVSKARQSYGLILDADNRICVVYNSHTSNWILPGGAIEKGETPLDALNREVYEEANTVLNQESIHQAYYQHVYEIIDGKDIYHALQVRYIARAERIDPFTPDPDEDITEVRWIEIDTIGDYLDWEEKSLNLIREIIFSYIKEG